MNKSRALYGTVREALLQIGVYQDDADWMGGIVAREIEKRFDFRPPEIPVHAGLRADLETICRELPELERQEPEHQADYILGRLEEKYAFAVRLSWYQQSKAED